MFKEKSEQMYPVMGEKTNKRLGGIKGCKVCFVCLFVSPLRSCMSLTADGPQRARFPIPPITSATLLSCHNLS